MMSVLLLSALHLPSTAHSQCYDNFLLEQLRFAAQERGQYQWGTSGPHDAGSYNDWPQSTGFFCNQGSFATDYGRFFLEWYSGTLLQHGDRVLEAAADAFAGLPTKLAAKVGSMSISASRRFLRPQEQAACTFERVVH